MEKVIPKGQAITGIVLVEIEDGEKKENLSLRGVRVGLSWPASNAPGFFVLVGQSAKKDITGQHPLHLLKEGQEQIPSALYERLADEMGAFFAEGIYTDMSERFQGYLLDFSTFRRQERQRQRLFLKRAPFYQDFSHGLRTIQGWVKKKGIHVPKGSVTYEQLKTITSEDLRQNPEERFFAINALRYVVGAFEVSNIIPQPLREREISSPSVGAYT
ncbi:MAG: hypothetical protein ACE144_13955 [Thermodesulfobacteriota bacterium]